MSSVGNTFGTLIVNAPDVGNGSGRTSSVDVITPPLYFSSTILAMPPTSLASTVTFTLLATPPLPGSTLLNVTGMDGQNALGHVCGSPSSSSPSWLGSAITGSDPAVSMNAPAFISTPLTGFPEGIVITTRGWIARKAVT